MKKSELSEIIKTTMREYSMNPNAQTMIAKKNAIKADIDYMNKELNDKKKEYQNVR
jgi:hypothetical protein